MGHSTPLAARRHQTIRGESALSRSTNLDPTSDWVSEINGHDYWCQNLSMHSQNLSKTRSKFSDKMNWSYVKVTSILTKINWRSHQTLITNQTWSKYWLAKKFSMAAAHQWSPPHLVPRLGASLCVCSFSDSLMWACIHVVVLYLALAMSHKSQLFLCVIILNHLSTVMVGTSPLIWFSLSPYPFDRNARSHHKHN